MIGRVSKKKKKKKKTSRTLIGSFNSIKISPAAQTGVLCDETIDKSIAMVDKYLTSVSGLIHFGSRTRDEGKLFRNY